jgi:virulence-associated protein VagC
MRRNQTSQAVRLPHCLVEFDTGDVERVGANSYAAERRLVQMSVKPLAYPLVM